MTALRIALPIAPATHELKTWPEYFQAVADGRKRFEIRFNDRGYKVGDTLLLREWHREQQQYTGRELRMKVTYLLSGAEFGLEPDRVVMSIASTLPAEPWTEQRPTEAGEYEVSFPPAKRDWLEVPAIVCYRLRADGWLIDQRGLKQGLVSATVYDGARWRKRQPSSDPFAGGE